jgi:hypothetical protein
MIYFEQPDGSGHQFTLTDPRQPTNPVDNRTVGVPGNPAGAVGQDPAKIVRYASYLQFAYQRANAAVDTLLDAIGSRRDGEPRRDVLVVSDHGMAPFHTGVNLRNLLANAGIDVNLIGIRTTGAAANIYVNLQGRQAGGAATPADYGDLVQRIARALGEAKDPRPFYNRRGRSLFSHVWTRSNDCGHPGFCTDRNIGQDTGDVLALMVEGYNFDGIQTLEPSGGVGRLGDAPFSAATTVYSVPNFYGAHGHDSELPSISAILYAAGPSIRRGRKLSVVHNIDVAPTVLEILGVPPTPTVDGEAIRKILRQHEDD